MFSDPYLISSLCYSNGEIILLLISLGSRIENHFLYPPRDKVCIKFNKNHMSLLYRSMPYNLYRPLTPGMLILVHACRVDVCTSNPFLINNTSNLG